RTVSGWVRESPPANDTWFNHEGRASHRLDLFARPHSLEPCPGPSLGLGFRPLSSLGHLGFHVVDVGAQPQSDISNNVGSVKHFLSTSQRSLQRVVFVVLL